MILRILIKTILTIIYAGSMLSSILVTFNVLDFTKSLKVVTGNVW